VRGIKEEWRLFSLYNFFFVVVEGLVSYILECETYGRRATKTRAAFLCLARKDV
jgi:hypothetical protein